MRPTDQTLRPTRFWKQVLETGLVRALLSPLLPLSLLFSLAVLYVLFHGAERTNSRPRAIAGTALPGIAVLPFEINGAGLDIWREGMVDLLSANLDGVAGLRAIDSRTVLARWRDEAQGATSPNLEKALEVARGTGARYAVLGSVFSGGSGMRLRADIYSLEGGTSLASLRVEGPPDSVFALIDRLSLKVLGAIWQGKEQPRGEVDLGRVTTTSLPALKAYLKGESLLRRADFEGAVAAYPQAVAADSTFAFALYRLGMAYAWSVNYDPRLVAEYFRRALRHVGRLPERQARLLRPALEFMNSVPELPITVGRLEEATRRYPDDADAWYFLGEMYFHAGEQLLTSQHESERAFRKAVELDPGFSLSYVHLVHNAFINEPDSARAAQLTVAYHRLARNSWFDQVSRLAFGLAFGDSSHSTQAFAALDTLSPNTVSEFTAFFLDHPRFWAKRAAVLEHRSRPGTRAGGIMTVQLFENALSQGKLRAALRYLGDPSMPAGFRAAGLYTVHSAGLRLPEMAADKALALPRADGRTADLGAALVSFYAGAHAADQGRWEDHAVAIARLRAGADRLLAEGDSADSRFTMGAVSALEGQGLWRHGEAQRSLPLLVAGQRLTTSLDPARRKAVNETIRWWLGELLLETGAPQEAALYFESFWNDPRAAWRLGQVYELNGEDGRAREAYALVASAWKDADPELQPRVREARAAVQRLASGVAE